MCYVLLIYKHKNLKKYSSTTLFSCTNISYLYFMIVYLSTVRKNIVTMMTTISNKAPPTELQAMMITRVMSSV